MSIMIIERKNLTAGRQVQIKESCIKCGSCRMPEEERNFIVLMEETITSFLGRAMELFNQSAI
jgi:hypothetical protein